MTKIEVGKFEKHKKGDYIDHGKKEDVRKKRVMKKFIDQRTDQWTYRRTGITMKYLRILWWWSIKDEKWEEENFMGSRRTAENGAENTPWKARSWTGEMCLRPCKTWWNHRVMKDPKKSWSYKSIVLSRMECFT